jgi:hypothetical protein
MVSTNPCTCYRLQPNDLLPLFDHFARRPHKSPRKKTLLSPFLVASRFGAVPTALWDIPLPFPWTAP